MNSKKKNKKCYVLTIEYNTEEDQCEYIQEEIKEEVQTTTTAYKIGTIDLRDYFTESELIGILKGKMAKT
jgi:hypothetical protein